MQKSDFNRGMGVLVSGPHVLVSTKQKTKVNQNNQRAKTDIYVHTLI